MANRVVLFEEGFPVRSQFEFKGPGVCLIQGTPGVGTGLMRSNGTTGAVELADGSLQYVGHMGRNTGVDTEYHEVILNI